MRLTPTALFNEIFPDRRDPQNPRHYLCRFCGKPTVDTRRRFYCGDECYNLCQRAVSWLSARRATWERDNKQCTLCKTNVKLYDGWHEEGEGDDVANCHHIKSVIYLSRIVTEAILVNSEWEHIDRDTKNHWWAKIYTILYLDINNLTTLCFKCHKMVHAADYRNQNKENPFMVARTKWGRFWKHNDALIYSRTLEDFLIVV